MKIVIGFGLLALLAACGDDQNAGGVTDEESRQLNEAAAMLDAAPAAGDETGLGTEPAPAAATGDVPTDAQ